MGTEIERIARMLEKTFDKSPWYGSSIMAILSDISPQQASHRIGTTHTILELVLHMVSWRIFATQRLSGNDEFQVAEEANFPTPSTLENAIQKLKDSQVELITAVNKFPESRLGEIVPGKPQKYTYYTLLHGIVQHDIYHLGQIQLIRKTLE